MSHVDGTWTGRLRRRGPARHDEQLSAIYDGLCGCEDLLWLVALLAVTAPPHYRLRSRRRAHDSATGAFRSRDSLSVCYSKTERQE